jgi:outer membrane protein assembly factor BamB
LLVSSGYGVGCILYKVSETDGKLSVTKEFENLNLKAKFANFAYRDGHVYGLDEGVMVSLDVATGKRAWKNGRYRHGQILMVGDLILVQAERGSLHLVEASPEAFTELGEIEVLGGKSWNTMAMAGNRLLMRNHKEAVLLELPMR